MLKQLEQWEDPARAWIDLVMSCKIQDKAQIQACMNLAQASQWTHDDWTEATHEASSTEEDDGEYPATQDDFFED